IMAITLTDTCTSDSSQVPDLLKQMPDILEGFYGDGAYDRKQVYEAIKAHQDWPVAIIIPPIETLQVPDDPSIELTQRQKHHLYLKNHGRDKWRNKYKYGRRDKVEGSFARFKASFGEDLLSRDNCAQITEIKLKCHYLNKVNNLYADGFM
ncbi:transposase, partial [Thiotrichales bacterium 19X7-9]|nr:transposase [Thiotrichales bacterium 19X7-9]